MSPWWASENDGEMPLTLSFGYEDELYSVLFPSIFIDLYITVFSMVFENLMVI